MQFQEQSQNLQRTYQQFVKKLNDQNPYIKLVGSFMPMIIFDNLSQMKTIYEILIKLEQEIQQQLDNLQEINNERQRYFNEQKARLQQDSDKWNQEMNAIDPVVKATQEKLESLKKQLEDQNSVLLDQQQKLEESQKFNDNYSSQYQNKHKEDLSKMGMIRTMKQLVYEHQSGVEEYLKSKVFV